jgi:hypothetical protein
MGGAAAAIESRRRRVGNCHWIFRDPHAPHSDIAPSRSARHAPPRCQRDVNQRPQPTATGEPGNDPIKPNLRLDATRRNRLRRNGKEGVDGSSPSEGFRGFPGIPCLRGSHANVVRGFKSRPTAKSETNSGARGDTSLVASSLKKSTRTERLDRWDRPAVDDVVGADDRGGAVGDKEGDELGDLVGPVWPTEWYTAQ